MPRVSASIALRFLALPASAALAYGIQAVVTQTETDSGQPSSRAVNQVQQSVARTASGDSDPSMDLGWAEQQEQYENSWLVEDVVSPVRALASAPVESAKPAAEPKKEEILSGAVGAGAPDKVVVASGSGSASEDQSSSNVLYGGGDAGGSASAAKSGHSESAPSVGGGILASDSSGNKGGAGKGGANKESDGGNNGPQATMNQLVMNTPSASAVAGIALAAQPIVTAKGTDGKTFTSYAGTPVLSGYTDSGCSVAASGFNAGSNTRSSGVQTFTGVKSTLAGSLYVKASDGTYSTACVGPIAISADSSNLSVALSSLAASPASGILADGSASSTVTVTVKDIYGNAVSGVSGITLSGTGSPTITQPSGSTNASGQITVTVKSSSGGSKSISISAPAALTAVVPVSIAFSYLGKLAISGASSYTAGTCTAYTVQLQTAAGGAFNNLSTRTITLTGKGVGGNFYSDAGCTTPISSLSFPSGTSSKTFYANDTGGELQYPTATDGTGYFAPASLWVTVSPAVNNNPRAVTRLWEDGAYSASSCMVRPSSADYNTTGGELWCWGGRGQYGSGSGNDLVPVKVNGLPPVIRVTQGQGNFCVVTLSGSIKCAGWNSQGQLGDGTTNDSYNGWVDVPGITDATDVSTGAQHSCAIVEGGKVKCWGNNQLTPVYKAGITDAVEIASNESMNYVILSDGSMKGWSGSTGAVSSVSGIGPASGAIAFSVGTTRGVILVAVQTSNGKEVKVWNSGSMDGTGAPLAGITNAKMVAGGGGLSGGHKMILLEDGTIKTWGANWFNTLGYPGPDTSTPATVPGVNDAVFVAASDLHECALRATGEVLCWGAQLYGHIGNGIEGWFGTTSLQAASIPSPQPVITTGAGTIVRMLQTLATANWPASNVGVSPGACTALTIRKTYNNANSNYAVPATLQLSQTGGTGTFYSDAACTQQITQLSVASGASFDQTFYYKGVAGESPTISVDSLQMNGPASGQLIVSGPMTQLVMSGPTDLSLDQCGTFTITAKDSRNLPPTPPSSPMVFNLTNTGSGQFYTSAACTTPTTTTTMAAGETTASIFFKTTSWVNDSIKATNGGITNSPDYGIVIHGPADYFAFDTPGSMSPGDCAAIQVKGIDSNFSDSAPFPFSVSVDLRVYPSISSADYYSDAACTNVITNTTIAAGTSSKTVYLKVSGDDDVGLEATNGIISTPWWSWMAVGCGSSGQYCDGPPVSMNIDMPSTGGWFNAGDCVEVVYTMIGPNGNIALPIAENIDVYPNVYSYYGGSVNFFSDSSCSNLTNRVSVPSGSTQTSVWFKADWSDEGDIYGDAYYHQSGNYLWSNYSSHYWAN